MEYRKLGRTNLKVSCVGLGGAQLEAFNVDSNQVKRIIDKALSLDVNFIDTAVKYKEEKLNLALRHNKGKMIVASKSTASTKEELTKDLKNSLKKLGLKKIPLYQFHGMDDASGFDYKMKALLPVLKDAKNRGLIDWIGAHGQNISVLKKAVKCGEFDVIMVPYNFAYGDAEEVIDMAYNSDMGIIAFEPFGRGILVDSRDHRLKKEVTANDRKFINHEVALKWILSNRKISTVIPGGNRLEYIEKNASVGSSDYYLSDKERASISKKVKGLVKDEYFRICNNPWGEGE